MSRSWMSWMLLPLAAGGALLAVSGAFESTPADSVGGAGARAALRTAEEEPLPAREARGPQLRGFGEGASARGRGTIRGVVVDGAGRPVAGARVCATSDTATTFAPTCTSTDAQGVFELGGLRDGMHRVEARTAGPPSLEAAAWLWTSSVPGTLVLAPPIPRLIVHALDPSGARIPRFLAHLTGTNTSEGYAGEAVLGLGFTFDAVDAEAPRTLHVWGAADAEVRGLDLGSVRLSLQRLSTEPIVVVLPALPAVDVEVVDEGGRPVPGTLVRLATRAGWNPAGSDLGKLVSHGISDVHGRARVARSEADAAHTLVVEPPPGFHATGQTDVAFEQISVRVVLFTMIQVAVRVEDEQGGAAGVTLEVWPLDPASGDPLPGPPQRSSTDRSGQAVLDVAEGRLHRVRVAHTADPSSSCEHASRTIERWLPAPTTWKLARARSLTVRVLDEDGRVYEGAVVQVFHGDDPIASSTLSTEHGRHTLHVQRPPEGPLRVVASDPALGCAREVQVQEDARDDVTIVMPAAEACEVDIEVRAGASTPLAQHRERARARVLTGEEPDDGARIEQSAWARGLRWKVRLKRWPPDATLLCWIPDVGHARVRLERGARLHARLEPGERIVLRPGPGIWVDGDVVALNVQGPEETGWAGMEVGATVRDGRVSLGGLPSGSWRVLMWQSVWGGGPDREDGLSSLRAVVLTARTGEVTDVPAPASQWDDEDRQPRVVGAGLDDALQVSATAGHDLTGPRSLRRLELRDAGRSLMDAPSRCEPARAHPVHGEVEDATQWAATTVRTMLERLQPKGVVEARIAEGGEWHEVRPSRARARRHALAIDRAFGGALDKLAHLLLGSERLDAKERARLEILRARDRKAEPWVPS